MVTDLFLRSFRELWTLARADMPWPTFIICKEMPGNDNGEGLVSSNFRMAGWPASVRARVQDAAITIAGCRQLKAGSLNSRLHFCRTVPQNRTERRLGFCVIRAFSNKTNVPMPGPLYDVGCITAIIVRAHFPFRL